MLLFLGKERCWMRDLLHQATLLVLSITHMSLLAPSRCPLEPLADLAAFVPGASCMIMSAQLWSGRPRRVE